MSPTLLFGRGLKIYISLLLTDLRPPGKNKWWKRSRSSTSPARLRTAEKDQNMAAFFDRRRHEKLLTELTKSEVKTELCACLRACSCQTHPADVSRPELNGAKQAQYDDDDVQEVGEDGSPLVAQEIYHLTLQHTDLRSSRREKRGAIC